MQTQTEESTVVIQRTRELCQTILEQPEVRAMRQKIDAFMADDRVRGQYESLMTQGQALQDKQRSGTTLNDAEVAAFEKLREMFISNPVARGFLDSQEEMHKLQQSVTQYVTKTLDLGRVPEESDLEGGSCGHGCGCHH
jgi:cell fate (sporulation/competence/biofilm development) regulator YlbF (YheA/YmcA/DUF963 family)